MTRNYGLQYNSPTCGCFFFSKEYLKFCYDLKETMRAELVEISMDKSLYANELYKRYKNRKVVLGKVLDAEIVLLHYSSFEEAKAKWDRRKARIRWDNMIVKYNDQNLFERDDFFV
ncbi:MAG: DUF1919 domain-containing protein, partial [Eubacterium sp.]|nr:DUF1919 domain-containing protein [Eubacterium sp.]